MSNTSLTLCTMIFCARGAVFLRPAVQVDPAGGHHGEVGSGIVAEIHDGALRRAGLDVTPVGRRVLDAFVVLDGPAHAIFPCLLQKRFPHEGKFRAACGGKGLDLGAHFGALACARSWGRSSMRGRFMAVQKLSMRKFQRLSVASAGMPVRGHHLHGVSLVRPTATRPPQIFS